MGCDLEWPWLQLLSLKKLILGRACRMPHAATLPYKHIPNTRLEAVQIDICTSEFIPNSIDRLGRILDFCAGLKGLTLCVSDHVEPSTEGEMAFTFTSDAYRYADLYDVNWIVDEQFSSVANTLDRLTILEDEQDNNTWGALEYITRVCHRPTANFAHLEKLKYLAVPRGLIADNFNYIGEACEQEILPSALEVLDVVHFEAEIFTVDVEHDFRYTFAEMKTRGIRRYVERYLA